MATNSSVNVESIIKDENTNKSDKKTIKNTKRKGELIFYYSFILLPIVQICIFYFGVNINSILLSFQEYKLIDGEPSFIWVGLSNFGKFFNEFTQGTLYIRLLANSLTFYAFGVAVGITLALLFSFYIYKKYFLSEFFRVMLFLPSVISTMVLVFMYKALIAHGIPSIAQIFGVTISDPLTVPESRMPIMLFFNTAIGFGTSTIMYSNAMSRIPVSVTEYARLDGVKPMREFFSLTLPMIFPTISTFLVAGVAGIFVNQANLHAMFNTLVQGDPEISTFGYELYVDTVNTMDNSPYPYAATRGLIYTFVACPLTLVVKKILDKIDPDVQY